jgi:hypothetical protein
MAAPLTNVTIAADQAGTKESFADIIADVDPILTPLYSGSAKTTARATVHKWQEWLNPGVTVTLAALADTYLHSGGQPDLDAVVATDVYDNVCSIHGRDYTISGTMVAVDSAGRTDELARHRLEMGMQVRSEIEMACLRNTAKVATEPRKMAGLPTYADGGDGSAPSTATPLTTPAAVEAAVQLLWDIGAANPRGCIPDTFMTSPTLKAAFSATADTGTVKSMIEVNHTSAEQRREASAVSVYLSDLGTLQVIANRYMEVTNAATVDNLPLGYVYDSRAIRIANIPGRNFDEFDVAPRGDARRRMIRWEGCLEVTSPSSVTIPK